MVLGNQLSPRWHLLAWPSQDVNRFSGQWTVEVESKGSGLIAGIMQELLGCLHMLWSLAVLASWESHSDPCRLSIWLSLLASACVCQGPSKTQMSPSGF